MFEWLTSWMKSSAQRALDPVQLAELGLSSDGHGTIGVHRVEVSADGRGWRVMVRAPGRERSAKLHVLDRVLLDPHQLGDPQFDGSLRVFGDLDRALALFDADTRRRTLRVVGCGRVTVHRFAVAIDSDVDLVDTVQLAVALASRNQEPVEQRLHQVLVGDPNPRVRLHLLEFLQRGDDGRTAARMVASDADFAVRLRAADLLADFETIADIANDPGTPVDLRAVASIVSNVPLELGSQQVEALIVELAGPFAGMCVHTIVRAMPAIPMAVRENRVVPELYRMLEGTESIDFAQVLLHALRATDTPRGFELANGWARAHTRFADVQPVNERPRTIREVVNEHRAGTNLSGALSLVELGREAGALSTVDVGEAE